MLIPSFNVCSFSANFHLSKRILQLIVRINMLFYFCTLCWYLLDLLLLFILFFFMLFNHLRNNDFHTISNFYLSLNFKILLILFAFLNDFIKIFNYFMQNFVLLVRSDERAMHQLLSTYEHDEIIIFKFLFRIVPRFSIFINSFFLENEI